jgi:hypothetical protein
MAKRMNSKGVVVRDNVRVEIPAWGKGLFWIWTQKTSCGCTAADFIARLGEKDGAWRNVLEGLHVEFVGASRDDAELFTSSNWAPLLAPVPTGRTAARTAARTVAVPRAANVAPAANVARSANVTRTAKVARKATQRKSRTRSATLVSDLEDLETKMDKIKEDMEAVRERCSEKLAVLQEKLDSVRQEIAAARERIRLFRERGPRSATPPKARTRTAKTARSPKAYTKRKSRSYEEGDKERVAELRKALAFARKKRGQELRPSASRSRSRSPKARTARSFGSYSPVKTGQGRGKGGEATVFMNPANAPFVPRGTSNSLLQEARTAANAAIAGLSRRAPRTSGVSQYKFGPSMAPSQSPSPARYNSSNSLDLNELRTRPGLTPVASLSPAAAVVAGRAEPVLGAPRVVPSENSEDLE